MSKLDSLGIMKSPQFKIVTVGDPELRQECKIVHSVESVKTNCQMMVDFLRELNGAGLAAPQIRLKERIIVVEVRKTDLFPNRPVSALYVMINPEIINFSEDVEEGWEGCFSIPNLMGLVERSKVIKVKYLDIEGEENCETFEGYLARVIQHECDHLDGYLFLDRMKSMESLCSVENYKLFHMKLSPN
jgi:peptide deformylase